MKGLQWLRWYVRRQQLGLRLSARPQGFIRNTAFSKKRNENVGLQSVVGAHRSAVCAEDGVQFAPTLQLCPVFVPL